MHAFSSVKMAVSCRNKFINPFPEAGFDTDIWKKASKLPVTKKRTKRWHSRGQRHRTRDMKEGSCVKCCTSPAHTFLFLMSLYSRDSICCFLLALLGLPDPTLIFFRTDVPFRSDLAMLQNSHLQQLRLNRRRLRLLKGQIRRDLKDQYQHCGDKLMGLAEL